MAQIRDLVEVPPVQTVVRFRDLAEDDARRRLLSTFVLTAETEQALSTLLGEIAGNDPQGHFLTGNYGSGKSHFLAVCASLLEEPAKRTLFAGTALDKIWPRMGEKRFLVVTVSLVEHAGLTYLEDIVTGAVRQSLLESDLAIPTPESFINDVLNFLLEADPQAADDSADIFANRNLAGVVALARRLNLPLAYQPNRRDTFAAFAGAWRNCGFEGMVLILDELSEFLLSKPDSHSFNEDIRFLQFLGEAAHQLPAWIVAAVQEQVEETGAIAAEILKKIKDRYPVRFSLSITHVRSLIEHRLIHKKPGAGPVLDQLFTNLTASFGTLPFSKEEFCALYPVHPLTVSFLSGLSNLFSQHRGVIDFIYHQLQGDPARNIPALLDEPPTSLLTADRIFDHFEDRLKANPELAPYYTTVYRYYLDELPRIFPNDADTALSVVKLLLLAAVYPYEKALSLTSIAYHLVKSLSSLDARVNFEYLQDILARLQREGAYVSSRTASEGEVFFIDLEADVARVVRRELEYVERGIFADDERFFTTVAKWMIDPALPLADWLVNPVSTEQVEWQNTFRRCSRTLGDLTLIQPSQLDMLLADGETDVALFIGTPQRLDDQLDHLEHILLPHLRAQGREANAVLFWLPRAFEPAEKEELRAALALALLRDKYEQNGTPQGRKTNTYLIAQQAQKAPRIKDIFLQAYVGGRRILGGCVSEPGPAPAATHFAEGLRHLAGQALDRCHPGHYKIMPQTINFPPTLPERFMKAMNQNGADFPENHLDSGLITAFQYLLPMKVARKVGRGYRLEPDPGESPLLAAYLTYVGPRPTPLTEVYRRLKDSEFGLDRNAFLLLSQVLLATGLLAAHKGGRLLNPMQVASQTAFWQTETLSRTLMIGDKTWQALAQSPLLPPRLARESLTLTGQEKAWEHIRQFKEKRAIDLANLESRLQEAWRLPACAGLGRDHAGADLELARLLLKEIKVSYPARQGLENLTPILLQYPDLEATLKRLDNLDRFLKEDLNFFLAIYGYIHALDNSLLCGVPELAQRHAELMRLTKEWSTLVDADHFRQLREQFARFGELYRQEYMRDHQAKVGPECFAAFDLIASSTAYRLLERFGGIFGLSADHDLVSVKRLLARVFEKRCHNDQLIRDLEIAPRCPCGFQLGQAASEISPRTVATTVDTGLREYLGALSEPNRYQKIISYLAAMENAGKTMSAAPVRELLRLTPDAGDLTSSLERLLTRQTADILNKSLAGRARQVDRNLDELYESLVDRSFAPADLKRRFEEWLNAAGSLGEDDFIRLTGAKRVDNSNQPGDNPFQSFLTGFPELIPLYRRLGFSSLSMLLTTLAWLTSYDQPAAEIRDLTCPNLVEDDLPALEDLAALLFAEPSPTALLVASEADRTIAEEGLAERFLDRQEAWIPEMIGRVTGERFFPFIFFPALRRLLAHLEASTEEKGLLATARSLARQSPDAFFNGRHGMEAVAGVASALASLAFIRSGGDQSVTDFQGWEKLYRDHLAPLGLNLALALDILEQLPLDPPFAPLGRLTEIKDAARRCEEAFARFLATGDPGSSLADLLQNKRKEMIKKTFPACVYHILLDGLRLDLWDHLLARLESGEPGGRIIARGFTWAALPTVTARQFDRLSEAGLAWPRVPAPELAGARAAELKDLGQDNQIISFGFPDTKIHTSKDDLAVLSQEMGQAFEREVIPWLRRLPEHSLCLFFADHGFRENPLFYPRDKYSAQRYVHGGNSPYEVLAPWTAYFKLK